MIKEATYSPNRDYAVIFSPVEMKMSHWVNCPRLVFTRTQETILDLSSSSWHADQVIWRDDSCGVTLLLRRYPGDMPDVRLEVDLIYQIARLHIVSQIIEVSCADALKELEKTYRSR